MEAANHLSLFLTTPGSTATSNQVLHKIVIVDQVSFHSLISPLSAKNVWQFEAILFASVAPQPSISKFLHRALSHPCATPVPPFATPVLPLCHACATPVLVMLASIMLRLKHTEVELILLTVDECANFGLSQALNIKHQLAC